MLLFVTISNPAEKSQELTNLSNTVRLRVLRIKNQVSQLITPRKVAQLEEKTIYQIISNYWMRLSMTSYKIVLLYRLNQSAN
mgnify:CR=1 FL=1